MRRFWFANIFSKYEIIYLNIYSIEKIAAPVDTGNSWCFVCNAAVSSILKLSQLQNRKAIHFHGVATLLA